MNNEKMNQIIDEAYENYLKNFVEPSCPPNLDVQPEYYQPISKERFIELIKFSNSFSEWNGLKIEERELSLDEKCRLANFAPFDDRFPEDDGDFKWDKHTVKIANEWLEQHHPNIPTKLITVTYNGNQIESYE